MLHPREPVPTRAILILPVKRSADEITEDACIFATGGIRTPPAMAVADVAKK